MPRVIKIFAVLVLALLPDLSHAHPSEGALVLLLPTEFYNVGGTITVATSVLLISLCPPSVLHRAFVPLSMLKIASFARIRTAASLVAMLAMFGLIYSGAFGPRDPQANLLPLVFWTGWWTGVFVIQGLVLDIWRWINPWTVAYDLLIGQSTPILTLPPRLGAWPSVSVFLAFQIFLMADIAPSDPGRLATIALGYWLFTFAGMIIFGKEPWLDRVECFSVLFRLIGSLRIAQMTDRLRVGLPGWTSLQMRMDAGLATFCMMILISGSFDGLKETFWWLGRIGINPLEFPGRSAVVMPSVLGLMGAYGFVFALYVAALALGLRVLRMLNGTAPRLSEAYAGFSIVFLPIALGYHFAHYFVSFLVQSQYLVAALGDPFARGWALFGLGAFPVTTGFLNTTDTVHTILLTNVSAVVISHVVSVVMAHSVAGRFAKTRRDLVAVQLGLSALMIAYTLFGLWLLSTPRGA